MASLAAAESPGAYTWCLMSRCSCRHVFGAAPNTVPGFGVYTAASSPSTRWVTQACCRLPCLPTCGSAYNVIVDMPSSTSWCVRRSIIARPSPERCQAGDTATSLHGGHHSGCGGGGERGRVKGSSKFMRGVQPACWPAEQPCQAAHHSKQQGHAQVCCKGWLPHDVHTLLAQVQVS